MKSKYFSRSVKPCASCGIELLAVNKKSYWQNDEWLCEECLRLFIGVVELAKFEGFHPEAVYQLAGIKRCSRDNPVITD